MVIGIDARVLQGQLRGQGQYVKYLVRDLLQADAQDRYVLFYNGFRRQPFFFAGQERLRQAWSRVPGRLLWNSWENFSLPAVERLIGKVDVFHNTVNFNFTHYTPVPCRCPMVVTFHGMTQDPKAVWQGSGYDFAKLQRWYRIIAARADRIIAVSHVARRTLLERTGIGEEKVRVIPCGVGEGFAPVPDGAARDAVLERYGLKGKRYILYVGTAEPNKNVAGMIEAFALLQKQPRHNDLYLALAGNPDENYRRILRRAEDSGLSRRLVMTGYVGHEELPSVYSAAALFVLPTFDEWFGIPLLEAMACGVPIAASWGGAVKEVAADAAALFDPGKPGQMADVVESLLNDSAACRSLVHKGLLRSRAFSWKNIAEQTLAVYREAAKL